MKKKILSLLMVFAFGFTIAGCDASIEDLKNQTNKMEDIIEEGKLFTEDWQISMTTTSEDGNAKYSIKRDGDNFSITSTLDGKTDEIILIKDSSTYTVYNVSEKQYTIMGAEDVKDAMDLDTLEMLYKTFCEMLKDLEEDCSKDLTCKFEKNLFGKLTLNVVTEEDVETTMILNKGKIMSITANYGDEESTYEFNYKNQTVSAPENKSEYTYIEA